MPCLVRNSPSTAALPTHSSLGCRMSLTELCMYRELSHSSLIHIFVVSFLAAYKDCDMQKLYYIISCCFYNYDLAIADSRLRTSVAPAYSYTQFASSELFRCTLYVTPTSLSLCQKLKPGSFHRHNVGGQ